MDHYAPENVTLGELPQGAIDAVNDVEDVRDTILGQLDTTSRLTNQNGHEFAPNPAEDMNDDFENAIFGNNRNATDVNDAIRQLLNEFPMISGKELKARCFVIIL